MTMRQRLRRLRLHWNSRALFRECLAEPGIAWRLPLAAPESRVEVRFKSGRGVTIAAKHWSLLALACRLERIGAEFDFLDDAKRIALDGLTFYSPLWTRNEAAYLKEVLLDDVYHAKGRDLRGRVVVDVGAYVGDATLAFARSGALVHAVEPSEAFCGFIRRNAEANGFSDSVVVHPVGLAERDAVETEGSDTLRFAEGVGYTLRKLPAEVDVLKLDCEGAEYYLLADPRFLGHLAPREIRMEYHRGSETLLPQLERAGYAVELAPSKGPVGLLTAHRSERQP
jgi:hypothetical protein